MAYKQKLNFCFKNSIGALGADKQQYASNLKKFKAFFNELKKEKLELFNFTNIDTKVKEIKSIVDDFPKNIKNLYILGTGGASLTGQTICALANQNNSKKTIFIDNVDPITIKNITENFDFQNSLIFVVSKSGGTIETVSQFILFLSLYQKSKFSKTINNHFRVITETQKENTIKTIADKFKIKSYQHDNVGGRFSIFSSVALVPACFSGLDIKKFLEGAKQVFEKNYNIPIEASALNACLMANKISITAIMPYIDLLKNFTVWWCQIWAESLGKNNKAATPLRAIGTIDQHSQLQLFLEGRKDKLFTIIVNKQKLNSANLKLSGLKLKNLEFLSNKKMHDIMHAAAYSTIETLKKNNLPVRVVEIEKLDEFTLGELCMHYILETVLMAKFIGVNAYDQPAVEQGKKIAISMLKK